MYKQTKMNRNFKDYVSDGRSFLLSQHLRRGHSLNGISRDSMTTTTDENLDLFSRNRRSISLSPSDESDALALKLGKISVGPVKVAKSGMDELLTSTDGGKHDYDWLLTPPETPLFTPSEGNEFQPSIAAGRTSSAARSVSATKASRLSNTHSESNHSVRPARSSSVNRSSISSTLSTTYSNRSSSILNTSSASVSSYIRPSSPATRSSSNARPTTPSRTTASRPATPPRTTVSQPSTPSRATASRPSTPSRGVRTTPASPSTDRSRPSVSSRPSTPNSRPQIAATPSNSRPSTPSRRNLGVTSSPSSNYTASTGRVLSSGRIQSSVSHPRSPGPRLQPQQPIGPPDFSLDRPPNLRTSLPSDRPVSAGRSRPGATAKVKMESPSSVSLPRRPSSPIVSRGRSIEPPVRGRQHANGHNTGITEPRKSSYSDSSMRKPLVKSSFPAENNGFGRNISKKSLDMAIRHMDIRNGPGSMRNLPSTTLYPQSVRSSAEKAQTIAHASCNSSSFDSDECLSRSSSNIHASGFRSENGKLYGLNYGQQREDGRKEDSGRVFARVSEVDIFESSRYDTMLLKEDVHNTNWLHSMDDDKSDQGLIFDNGFEALPEPFSLTSDR